MIDTLARWNRWGTGKLASGIPREATRRIGPVLDTPEVVGLIGPRRSGKTTVLFQVMDSLEAAGVSKEAFLHINFEEPGLSTEIGPSLLDRIYDSYRVEVYPTGKAYLFLDEIQHVPGWERWVRARNESEKIKVYVTGSSSALMSRELATLLTGRHITFRVMPLSFQEFLHFKSIPRPARPRLAGASPLIQHALVEYLQWGGFPEVVLSRSEERKELLLKQYFDDVLFKDVALRHQIRDLSTLRSLGVHLLTQTASLVSYQRIAKMFGVSLELAHAYCSYLQEAFLVEFLPFYSLKVAERNRQPQKVHAVDLGLRNAVCLSGSPDKGRSAETAVHGAVSRTAQDDLFHWKSNGEVDLLVRRGGKVTSLIQVVWEVPDDAVLHRERQSLTQGSQRFRGAKRILVAGRNVEEISPKGAQGVKVLPLWRFLLEQKY